MEQKDLRALICVRSEVVEKHPPQHGCIGYVTIYLSAGKFHHISLTSFSKNGQLRNIIIFMIDLQEGLAQHVQ